MLLLVLGPLIGSVLFAHGQLDLSDARLVGATLAGFAVGLVPFSAFQMQLRAWLAIHDARTPALVNLVITAVNVAADLALYLALPARERVVGLAVGFALSYLLGALVFARKLRQRLGPANERRVGRTHVRLTLAALVAAAPTYLAGRLLTHGLGLAPGAALVAVIVASTIGIAVFVTLARRMRIRELAELGALLRRSLPGA
jgi:putative peptidoglycan lipid II flippase